MLRQASSPEPVYDALQLLQANHEPQRVALRKRVQTHKYSIKFEYAAETCFLKRAYCRSMYFTCINIEMQLTHLLQSLLWHLLMVCQIMRSYVVHPRDRAVLTIMPRERWLCIADELSAKLERDNPEGLGRDSIKMILLLTS